MPTPAASSASKYPALGVVAVLLVAALLLAAVVWRGTGRPEIGSQRQAQRDRSGAGEPVAAVSPSGHIDAQGVGTSPPSREDVVEKALRGVVTIHYETPRGLIQGSGFLISDDLIITNKHVIEDAGSTVDVELSAERSNQTTATVAKCSARTDLAVLELRSRTDEANSALPVADISTVRAGEEVVAVGSPKGLMGTVTRGIVSAVRTDGDIVVIQTDAAINPGNSGGPLLNMRGAVIGVNTLRYSGRDVQSIGFAVAANHVKDLVEGRESSSGCSSAPRSEQRPPPEPPPSIVSVAITPNISVLKTGETAPLELRATFSDRTTGLIRSQLVTWTSNDANVLRITPSGSLTGGDVGTGVIVARVAGQPELRTELQVRVVPN
ncbi:MAG: trypsin-like peptidase domain-containing protein [Acidobacteria bacterium]|nr:trypsin-like peptidase domain-containing protein [Acidobacteriota bacterium]